MKQNLFKKILTVCAIATLSVSAFAQTAKTEPVMKIDTNKNYLDTRTELIKKYGVANALSMGWYTGVVDSLEVRDSWNNYILLANYLSDKLGRLIVLETSQSDREITVDALSNMDLVYTSAVMGVDLMKKGWKPVVGRTESIQAVILVNEDTKITNPKDLRNLRVFGVTGATVTYFALNSLVKDGVYKTDEVSNNNSNVQIVKNRQSQLFELLKNREAGGVITCETIANNYMKANPGKFKVGFKAELAPGHIVFVSPNVKEEVVNQIRESLLALTPDNPSSKKILQGLDGYQENDKTPFKVVSAGSVAGAAGVLTNIGEKPIFEDKK